MSRLIEASCIRNGLWICHWVKICFRENVIIPNRNHIHIVMGLSDALTKQVVFDHDAIIEDWNRIALYDVIGQTINYAGFFTDEDKWEE